jgi:hypothetical protein
MAELAKRLEAAIADFDALNARDPRFELENGARVPQELLYARRMSACLQDMYPSASEELCLATRAQHVCRWEIPRDTYPKGRDGYNAWRRACREHHAAIAADVLSRHGYSETQIAQVAKCIRKEELKRDPESQALENVAAIVFVKYYLQPFAEAHNEHDEAKLVDILRKTVRKMDANGRDAMLALQVPPKLRRIVEVALAS